MPTYTFRCAKCAIEDDHVLSIHEIDGYRPICRCGNALKRIYRLPQVSVFQEYTSKDFNGEPITVRSPKHEQELCRVHNRYRATSDEFNKPRKPPKPKMEPIKETYDRIANQMKYGQYSGQEASSG